MDLLQPFLDKSEGASDRATEGRGLVLDEAPTFQQSPVEAAVHGSRRLRTVRRPIIESRAEVAIARPAGRPGARPGRRR